MGWKSNRRLDLKQAAKRLEQEYINHHPELEGKSGYISHAAEACRKPVAEGGYDRTLPFTIKNTHHHYLKCADCQARVAEAEAAAKRRAEAYERLL